MTAAASRFHQYPLLWLLLTGAVGLALLIAVDQNYMAAMFAADRSYLCILILIIFFCASVHVGVHTFSVSRELERAQGFLEGGLFPRPAVGGVSVVQKRFGLMPQSLLDEFVAEICQADGPNDQQHNARQQTLEIFADRVRAPVEIGWYTVDVLIRLGLIGTIIGFILIFASLNDGPAPNAQNIQSLLVNMSGGMGTALYTTLLGLITATLLGTQYMILGRSVEQLIAGLIRLGRSGEPGGAN